MHLRLVFVFCEGPAAHQRRQKMYDFKIKLIKFHRTSMAYVKKLNQFLYCDLYGTTLTGKHKDIHSFYPFPVACKQLFF